MYHDCNQSLSSPRAQLNRRCYCASRILARIPDLSSHRVMALAAAAPATQRGISKVQQILRVTGAGRGHGPCWGLRALDPSRQRARRLRLERRKTFCRFPPSRTERLRGMRCPAAEQYEQPCAGRRWTGGIAARLAATTFVAPRGRSSGASARSDKNLLFVRESGRVGISTAGRLPSARPYPSHRQAVHPSVCSGAMERARAHTGRRMQHPLSPAAGPGAKPALGSLLLRICPNTQNGSVHTKC